MRKHFRGQAVMRTNTINVLLAVSLLLAILAAAPSIITIRDSTVTDDAGWGKGFVSTLLKKKKKKGPKSCYRPQVRRHHRLSQLHQSIRQRVLMLTCRPAFTDYHCLLAGPARILDNAFGVQDRSYLATIQFGHNDRTAEKVMNTATFADSLKSLTNKIQGAGCSPILVTSLCRRTFSGTTLTDILAPYSDQTIAVARTLKLPLLPLLADCKTYIQKLGKPNAMQFNLDYTTTVKKDTTHLNELGARYFGRMVADEVEGRMPALGANVKADAELSAKIAAGTL
ncbi:hypothetical protein D9615_008387 [Tricholomella constricta]|uniref:SGNH hydrolase-type esterase domain-containing protein n=1 Tax=Tricholomella constricta TaxID=117010 RepID=A0A8H5M4X4_9AGAR|nr:hypothetical protein D9615_008387 [Tricholomella constricta]